PEGVLFLHSTHLTISWALPWIGPFDRIRKISVLDDVPYGHGNLNNRQHVLCWYGGRDADFIVEVERLGRRGLLRNCTFLPGPRIPLVPVTRGELQCRKLVVGHTHDASFLGMVEFKYNAEFAPS